MSPENTQSRKKVLIACPTCGLPDPDPNTWVRGLVSIISQVTALGMDYAVLFPYRLTWWPANNFIWDTAFEHKFDYILRIDDDVHQIPINAIKLLVEADKAVIGAAYPNRRFPYKIQAVNRTTPESLIDICVQGKQVLRSVAQNPDAGPVTPVDLVGFGMTLIRVSDFKYFQRPMFQGVENVPDDTYFAQMCLNNKIQQYVHLGVQLSHAHVNFRNNGFLFNADVLSTMNTPVEIKKDEANSPAEL